MDCRIGITGIIKIFQFGNSGIFYIIFSSVFETRCMSSCAFRRYTYTNEEFIVHVDNVWFLSRYISFKDIAQISIIRIADIKICEMMSEFKISIYIPIKSVVRSLVVMCIYRIKKISCYESRSRIESISNSPLDKVLHLRVTRKILYH